MVKELFFGLIYNTSLLLVLSMLYSSLTLRLKENDRRICFLSGVVIGIVGIGIMTHPIPLVDGIFFDTRSILISSTGLFFGFGPTFIATLITSAYRLHLGGIGAPTGVLVIVTSAAIGLLWRKFRFEKLTNSDKRLPVIEFYLMGMVTHIAMLLEMLTLGAISTFVLRAIFLPVIIIYPIGSLMIGIILKCQFGNKKTQDEIQYNENKYRTLVDEMNQSLLLVEVVRNGDGAIENLRALDANSNFYRMTGTTSRAVEGEGLPHIMGAKDKGFFVKLAEQVLEKDSYTEEYFMESFGKYFEFHSYKTREDQFAMLINDITKRKELEKSILESENRYRSLFNNNLAVMLLVDSRSDKIVDANPSACSFYMHTLEELRNMKISDINILSEKEIDHEKSLAVIEGRKHCNFIHKLSNGEARDVEVYSGPIEIGGEKLIYSIIHDVTEKVRRQKEIEYLSFHDQLTGLYNRRYFEEELNRLDVKRNLPLSLIMADLNGLKLVNDAFGHAMGDKLLVSSAEIIKSVCREDDIISRVGGDEMVILLPNTGRKQAYRIIERIREIAEKSKFDDFNISISFGLSTKTEKDQVMETVYKEAEDNMYKNKLFESKKMKGNMIDTIVNALYEKSPREKNHSERVSRLCGQMGIALDLSRDEINELKSTALLHDIGKVALDDAILNRKVRITKADDAQMMRHPDIGYNILSSVNNLSIIAENVLAHHERWDGRGYPKGLKGEEIPYIARIIALADAYDKMTDYERHRRPMTGDEAAEEIRRCSGTQFDPVLAAIFIEKVLKKDSKDAV
ncbi:PAS domain S-box-containing protein/diguanylate cyclase (GGDEF) domain-containing protein [Dethiosulfatibacter aminovorans DSM 17477]|uniref:PAS domain S-box-containing protein/diguanylate cyclase (GGDEF) domain-containing protein n=1 Tax=Dethiosulfatibacter aminovorans DSM 17477 TaxID=1121476 RepID=A0A1M6EGI7_9FIRM|nr:diguanylate cyclase [Dethiosulfatibacter aminovorans]SHI84408.1 PAS domain S-box-containing protein/diguanylate cyclase (GGDEF) domain-containing protein [Dethiosulfatibacter aminovorans DSM 17477]